MMGVASRSLLGGVLAAAFAASVPEGAAAPTADRLEPGLQGQTEPGEARVLPRPYSTGVQIVGHAALSGRDSNLQLAWVDSCAYVSTTSPNFLGWGISADPSTYGVAVIDVRDPRAPKQVGLLRDRGSLYASETIHAVAAPDRKVLAAGSYGAPDDAAYTDLYDVSDCANPKHMSEIKWPESVHTLTLSPNGKRLYGTDIDPFTGKGGIIAFDIADLSRPRLIGKFAATKPDGTSFEFAAHEISLSPDEKRIYAGAIAATDGELSRRPGAKFPSVETFGPDAGGILIFDNSDIAEGKADPKLRLIGTAAGGGWHSVMRARIGGLPYLVGGAELGACPGSWPRFTSIADEAHPVVVGEFKLAMNHAENCPQRTDAEKMSAGVTGAPGTAALHFNDVDSADDTRLGLFNFMWAGLRIVDLRDPAKPSEVAYFKPGDACTGHVRYLPKTGQIWLVCGASGFHVLALKPDVRKALGLPRTR
jgi:hypothetical protein